jgi:hypothetical protein
MASGRARTKRGTNRIDKILIRLPKSVSKEFTDWCWFGPSYTDMKTRLNEYIEAYSDRLEDLEPAELSITTNVCHSWYEREYPVGDEIKQFNMELRKFQGVDTEKIPQRLIVDLVKLSEHAMTKLRDEALAGIDTSEILKTLPPLIAQIRGLNKDAEKYKAERTIHETRMEAAQIVVQTMLATFKDQPAEDAIQTAVIDAMLEVERWSRQNLD